MDEIRRFEMMVDLPFLRKGALFDFEYERGWVYGVEADGKQMEYPLRTGLASYLWLLLTEGNKYLREVKS